MTAIKDDNETEPVMIDNSAETVTGSPKKKKRLRFWVILVGIVIVLVGGAAGGYFGYLKGISLRVAAQNDQVVFEATQQFQQGIVDLQAGRYDVARTRFEYVISIDPSFPGVEEKLTEVMMAQSIVDTPTPEPSPTAIPTADTRNEDQLFSQIQQDMTGQNWQDAVTTIERLRDVDLQYRAVDVDGMYYIALRNLGVQKILTDGELEVGIYYLTESEEFAPLDVDAVNYRNWARMYISAASFWDVDWAKVVSAFGQIYQSLPGLHDSSNMTATERFRQASIGYGDQLFDEKKYCDAAQQYQNSLNIGADSHAQQALSQSTDYCNNPPGSQNNNTQPTATPTLETPVGPTEGAPTGEAPTNTPQAPTEAPTNTPVPPTYTPAPTTPPEPTATTGSDSGTGDTGGTPVGLAPWSGSVG